MFCLYFFLAGNSKLIHLLHNSEHPTSVFSILDTGTKQIPLVADSLFDLLILKMQPAYSSKKQTKVRNTLPLSLSLSFKWNWCCANTQIHSFEMTQFFQIESKGPRFELCDFVIKLGSVTMSQTFKGILVEVSTKKLLCGAKTICKFFSLFFFLSFSFRWSIVRVWFR